MSKAASEAYAAQQTALFTSRVPLSEKPRELLESMFALAWQEGYIAGVRAVASMIPDKLP